MIYLFIFNDTVYAYNDTIYTFILKLNINNVKYLKGNNKIIYNLLCKKLKEYKIEDLSITIYNYM